MSRVSKRKGNIAANDTVKSECQACLTRSKLHRRLGTARDQIMVDGRLDMPVIMQQISNGVFDLMGMWSCFIVARRNG